jgi:hypothetical protein
MCRLDDGRTADIENGERAMQRRQNYENTAKSSKWMSLANFIKIAVIISLNILARSFAYFVDIYVRFMTEARPISIIVSWPYGDVVSRKKFEKKLENWDYGSF